MAVRSSSARASRGLVIGLDLGGTKIAGGVVKDGKVLDFAQRPTEAAKGRTHVIANIRAVIDQIAQGRTIAGVGIGVPGTFKGTRIVSLPNVIALNGVDLKRALKLRCPVVLENDARCFALAESRHGAGKGKRDVIALTLGTGLGVCFFIDDRLVRGANGAASEGGHMYPSPHATPEGPDWESYLSGPGILKRYRSHGGTTVLPSDIWRENSRAAKRTREEIARSLAVFTVGLCRALDPALVVVGGSVAVPRLLDDANRLLPAYGRKPLLRKAKLKHAGVVGAALALREAKRS